MQRCQDSCPKLKQKSGPSRGLDKSQSGTADSPSYTEPNGDPKGLIVNSRGSPSPHLKSVKVSEVSSVEGKDSQNTESSLEAGTDWREAGRENTQSRIPRVEKEKEESFDDETISGTVTGAGTTENRKFQPSRRNNNKMSTRDENPRTTGRREIPDWDTSGHNPCDSNCPMAKAKDRAFRKAQLRQERLDNYLLTKGFSYFDDLCTCSSICLFNQLRRDKFVLDFLKSVCLFGIGMKLCDELDAWSLFG